MAINQYGVLAALSFMLMLPAVSCKQTNFAAADKRGGEGDLNRLDTDEDHDGIPTSKEDLNHNGNPDDDDSDGDTVPDYLEPNTLGSADGDNDGIANYLDPDDDGDGVVSKEEVGPDPKHPIDTDHDDIPDYLDPKICGATGSCPEVKKETTEKPPEEPAPKPEEQVPPPPPPSTGKDGDKPGVFFACPTGSDKALYPIYVLGYKMESFIDAVNQDRESNSTSIFTAYDGRKLYFMKNKFKTGSGNVLDQQPFVKFCMTSFNVTERRFTDGFPMNDGSGKTISVLEWFGLDAFAELYVPKEGIWDFELESDDGSLFYIDNELIVDNDGRHESYKQSAQISLTRGVHRIRMKYFQGPKYGITLLLKWRLHGTADYEIVPRYEDTKAKDPRGFVFYPEPYKQDY